MNNIEILEKLVERCKECKFACCEQCEINNTQVRAIENLIKENKELKEGLKYRINYCKLLEKELYANGVNTVTNFNEMIDKYYISKDILKELRLIDNIDLIQYKLKELLGL